MIIKHCGGQIIVVEICAESNMTKEWDKDDGKLDEMRKEEEN